MSADTCPVAPLVPQLARLLDTLNAADDANVADKTKDPGSTCPVMAFCSDAIEGVEAIASTALTQSAEGARLQAQIIASLCTSLEDEHDLASIHAALAKIKRMAYSISRYEMGNSDAFPQISTWYVGKSINVIPWQIGTVAAE